jgi:uncharacterized protein (TIGR02145 family)
MRNVVRPIYYLASVMVCLIVIITCIKVEKVVMVSTGSVNNVQANSAKAEGTVVDIGEGITQHGHVYGTSSGVTLGGSNIETKLGSKGTTGTFTSDLTNLTAGTTYYIRAYVIGSSGTQLGKEISFKTSDPVVPLVTTTAISSITTSAAISGGEVTADGGAPVTARGVCWGTTTGPTITNGKTTDGSGTGSFTSSLSNLVDGTTYYIKAYATNTAGTGYGNEISFSTVAIVLPTVATTAAINISSSFAQVGGNVTSDGGGTVTAKGVCYSTSPNPTINDPKTSEGSGSGAFGSGIATLQPATLYHIRAYATNKAGTAYGEDLTFTTQAGLPVVTTAEITGITGTGAVSGGNITNNGGSEIITRGICWNTTGNPTTDGPKTTDGNGSGTFISTLTGLTTNTKYYIRAYATNSIGLSFGEELTFTTLGVTGATLTTTDITGITKTTAVGGGNITDNGGSSITSRGVCWSMNQSPTLADPHTTDDFGSGIFNSQLINLSPGKTYYVRAYAINSTGTTYGLQVSFITASDVPTVTTTVPLTVTSSTADPGGEVTDNNGSTTTTRGICYNTVGSPTTSDNKKDESGGLGAFTMALSGLTPSTTYYARAYAVNSIGTAYGPPIQFTTKAATAAISTIGITGLASTSVISGGNITSDGGSPVATRGVCWSASSNPTIALSTKTNDGSGSGVFPSKITSLLPNTKYYVRAFATNSLGTTFYGDEVTFTTTITVSDFEGHIYNTVLIGTQLWMQENLKATKYRDGTSIKYLTDITAWSTETAGSFCWYGNSTLIGDTYGALYNYYTTIENSNLCPTGWRVPTDADWAILTSTLGGETVAGGKMKEAGITHWNTPNTGATNESNFAALPGGTREATGAYTGQINSTYFWSSTSNTTGAWDIMMYYADATTAKNLEDKRIGHSVRCIQGEGQVLPAVTTTPISGKTSTGAISGGNITSDGNSVLIARGVCWSTSPNPTVDLTTKTVDGSAPGTFISSISGLTLGVTYYVRAYATNSVGTAYGDEISFTTTIGVGDAYQGGLIAYVFQSGDPGYIDGQFHGLIVTTSDQSTGASWGCLGTLVSGADGTAIGTGNQNTTDIHNSGCALASEAANICYDLVLGGYSDWYLPSLDELSKVYLNRLAIGGFVNNYYWSSSEYISNASWNINFTDGSQHFWVKSGTWYVRAVRSF